MKIIHVGKHGPHDLYDRIKSGQLRVSKKAPASVRFWRDLTKEGPIHPVVGQCWIWLRGNLSDYCAYGHISVKHKHIRVHRFSYELHFGKVPEGLHVLHRCDTPLCVNPSHLFLGTEQENKDDMVSKGRQAKGSECGGSKLTEEQVTEIKRRYVYRHPKHGQRAMSREFGVSQAAIHLIISGKNWRYHEDSVRG